MEYFYMLSTYDYLILHYSKDRMLYRYLSFNRCNHLQAGQSHQQQGQVTEPHNNNTKLDIKRFFNMINNHALSIAQLSENKEFINELFQWVIENNENMKNNA